MMRLFHRDPYIMVHNLWTFIVAVMAVSAILLMILLKERNAVC